MKRYIFKPHVYETPFTPYYDSYKNHVFQICGYHPEPNNHVYLKCIDDPSIKVNGCVEMEDLEEYE